jgi:ketosteroid isomerase-like protein
MEDERVETIRAAIEAFNRGDFEGLAAFAHEDIEVDDPDRTGKTWHGHDVYREFLPEWLEAFDEYRAAGLLD